MTEVRAPEVRWFGEPWAPVTDDDADRIGPPLGAVCAWCTEPIGADDRGLLYVSGEVVHAECHLATVFEPPKREPYACVCSVPGVVAGQVDRERARALWAVFMEDAEQQEGQKL